MKKALMAWCCCFLLLQGKTQSLEQPSLLQSQPTNEVTDFLEKLMTPSEQFDNSLNIFASYGFASNVNLSRDLAKTVMPPVTLSVQWQQFKNLGPFVTLSTQHWKLKDLPYAYRYYLASIGVTHRLSWEELLEVRKLESYFSLMTSYRLVFLRETGGIYDDRKQKLSLDFVFGIIYHLNERIGVFGEVGSSDVSCYNLGALFKFKI